MSYEFKGTPGPWHAAEEDIISMADVDDGGDIICDAPAYAEDNMKRWKYNARAIAAVPELIEALDEILGQAESDWKIGETFDGRDELVHKARAALAKATGGSDE